MPDAFRDRSVCSRAASPGASRLAFGSSRTTSDGIAIDSARAGRCAGAGRRTVGRRRHRSAYCSPPAARECSRAPPARLGRAADRLRRGIGIEARNVLRDGAVEQFDVLRHVADLAADFTVGSRRSDPNRQFGPQPLCGCHKPSSTCASVDLPAALGPITPSASPASSLKLMSLSTGRSTPGGAAQTVRSFDPALRSRKRHLRALASDSPHAMP